MVMFVRAKALASTHTRCAGEKPTDVRLQKIARVNTDIVAVRARNIGPMALPAYIGAKKLC